MSGFSLACPYCGSEKLIPIGYGPPTPDLIGADETGEYHRVDREWHEGAPTVHCSTCGFDWNDLAAEGDDLDDDLVEEHSIGYEWIITWVIEHTDLPRDTVEAVLALSQEFWSAICGEPAPGDHGWRWFDPHDWRGHPRLVDLSWLALEAHRLLGVDPDQAHEILAAEHDYLARWGMASTAGQWVDDA